MKNACKKVIETRKSTRSFSSKNVSNDDILDIIDAARLAPCAKNKQNWKYCLLTEKQKEEVIKLFHEKLIAENTEETGLETVKILNEASKLVIVFMDHKEIIESNHSLVPYYLSVGANI